MAEANPSVPNFCCPNLQKEFGPRGRQIFTRTLELVRTASVTNTPGELDIARSIHQELRDWPYFLEHPGFLCQFPVEGDPLARQSVVALVKGEATPRRKTVVYLGHFDTVGTDEYGDLAGVAHDSGALANALGGRSLPVDVRQDLESGQWLFGRGVADMKGGVALLLQLLKEAADAVEELAGNLLLVLVPDEEADSRGMLSLAGPLVQLKEREKLDLVGAINTDIVCPLPFEPDNLRYFYLGAIGKILPAVYAVGREAHVGECLQGFDVNHFLSELTCRLDFNLDLSDSSDGVIGVPPVSLKQVDLKDHYNGQVPYEGFAYYNFLNYERGPEEVLELVREQAEGCFKICLDKLQKARERYARSCGGHSPPFELQHGVLTYDELFSLTVKRLGEARVTAELESVRKEFAGDPNHDLRELSLALVRRLWKLCGKTGPAAIVFIVPPYYPPNNPRIGDENSNRFNEKVHQAAASLCEGSPYSLEVRPFFPYLSDASFCSYREGKNNRMALERNMPCWEKGWKIDIDQVMRLNLPVLDMGVHGKDPHKIYERLDIRYAMIELPDMVAKMTRVLLAD